GVCWPWAECRLCCAWPANGAMSAAHAVTYSIFDHTLMYLSSSLMDRTMILQYLLRHWGLHHVRAYRRHRCCRLQKMWHRILAEVLYRAPKAKTPGPKRYRP